MKHFVILLAGLLFSGAQAGELVHQFVNPSFGGNPFNSSHLLSIAGQQNNYQAPAARSAASTPAAPRTEPPTAADLFIQQVDRLLLSALANRVVNQALGTNNRQLPEDTQVDTGINTISVVNTLGGTEITIVDNVTGKQSVIFVPSF